MNRKLALVAVAATIVLTPAPAQADENYFGYSYGAETLPKSKSEAYLWLTDRRAKEKGHYDAQDYKIEIEHGVTDRLQVSGYVNFASHHIRGLAPDFSSVQRNLGFQGFQASAKYRVLSPYKDGIGLAFYVEPGWSRIHKVGGENGTELELELKAIVQKNFSDDRLVWVGNLTLEPELERESETITPGVVHKEWKKELGVELTTGLSYRVANGWFLGAEGRYKSAYPDFTRGLHREYYSLSAGPAIHYASRNWWLTATYLPQLRGGPRSPGTNLHLDEQEKRELRLKIGYNF